MLYKKSDLLTSGMAIFAMFFGAGNIIFPLVIGKEMLEKTPYALLGLLITAVAVPFSGLFAMVLHQGNVQSFFDCIGKKIGLSLAFLIIALLGPLGSTPRCIALSFSTLHMAYPAISPLLFNAAACLLLFFMAYKRQNILRILGYLLTPLLVGLLTFIILKGFWDSPSIPSSLGRIEPFEAFWKGLKEGYNTMDLLAAFFFAPMVLRLIQKKREEENSGILYVLKAGAIGAFLLSLVYIGFSFLASKYSADLQGVPAEELLAMISFKILGSYGGVVVCLTVVLACLTTAVALIAAFSGFIHQEILQEKGSYPLILSLSLLATFLTACFEFQAISRWLTPVLEISYPFLIILTSYHLWAKLKARSELKPNLRP